MEGEFRGWTILFGSLELIGKTIHKLERSQAETVITFERNVLGIDITSQRNVQRRDII